MYPDAYSEHCHIYKNLGICRTLTYLKPDTNSKPSQRSKMASFAKIVKNYNYFSKALYPHRFWISLNKYSALCIVWRIFRVLFIIVNSDIFRRIHVQFRHNQPCSGKFRTLCTCFKFRTLVYSKSEIYLELCQARHILAYSEHCVTLAYWEPCQIQNFAIFRILGYLEP